MKLFIDKEKKSILLDDGIRIQYNLYIILMILIFIGQGFGMVSNFEGFTPLITIWFLTLFGGMVILLTMWFRTTTQTEIRMDEIKQVKSRKYLNGTFVQIKLKNGKARELSFWLSEREKVGFLSGLKENGLL